ncbi:hypothetical protein BN9982_20045 [Mycobacterium tuberculosis]|nr:hypothetical protein BN9982_20045 [Mycobacterium tuberculosis]
MLRFLAARLPGQGDRTITIWIRHLRQTEISVQSQADHGAVAQLLLQVRSAVLAQLYLCDRGAIVSRITQIL